MNRECKEPCASSISSPKPNSPSPRILCYTCDLSLGQLRTPYHSPRIREQVLLTAICPRSYDPAIAHHHRVHSMVQILPHPQVLRVLRVRLQLIIWCVAQCAREREGTGIATAARGVRCFAEEPDQWSEGGQRSCGDTQSGFDVRPDRDARGLV